MSAPAPPVPTGLPTAAILPQGAAHADEWLPLLVSLVTSTLITIAVTAVVLRFLSRHRDLPQDTP